MKTHRIALALTVLFATASFAEADAPALWKKHCKGCHGDTGKGDTKKGKELDVEDMTTADWQSHMKDDAIKDAITNGLKKTDKKPKADKMKSFKEKLSADEIDALVKYVRTLKS